MSHDDRTRDANTPSAAGLSTGALVHSRDVDHFKLPDGRPDPRGWDVRSADGRKLGKVEDLLVDTTSGQIRYLEIDVDDDVRKAGGRDFYLLPVGAARLDDAADDVIVNLSADDLRDVPVYERARFSRDYERSLHGYLETRPHALGRGTAAPLAAGSTADRARDFYASPYYDDRSFFGSRRADAARGGRSGAADRATTTGLGDRLADTVDNVKDRVDGNPASRPGPDPTDRPLGRA